MPIHNEGLAKELEYVTDPEELRKIMGMFEGAEPIMHDIAHGLITAKHLEVGELTKAALDAGHSANAILDGGLISGMAVVGVKFRDGILFVPEVLAAARAMKAGMAHVEPILAASGVKPIGKVVIGTVKGDLHDVGKNLCIMMLRGAGFTVHDLGIDTKPQEFIDAILEHNPDVLGMSALLTTTMPNMGKTIDAIEEAGLRGDIRIMVGGAPLFPDYADDIGADGYGKDAMACVELAKKLMGVDHLAAPVPLPAKK